MPNICPLYASYIPFLSPDTSPYIAGNKDCWFGVAILVAVVAVRTLYPLGVLEASEITGNVRLGFAIFVFVIAFGPLDPIGQRQKRKIVAKKAESRKERSNTQQEMAGKS